MSMVILPINIQTITIIRNSTMAGRGTQRLHPGRRKANPDATKNGKPKIKGWALARLEEAIESASRNKEKARYRNEIARRSLKV
jgi:hypothetical protein